MIAHKNFESNCKRIAKAIMKDCDDTTSDAIFYGVTSVDVSSTLIKDFKRVGAKDYIKGINKYLKGCSVKHNTTGTYSPWFISFYIEFDDVDPETEDW